MMIAELVGRRCHWLMSPPVQLLLATPVQFIAGFTFTGEHILPLETGVPTWMSWFQVPAPPIYSLIASILIPHASLYFEASVVLITLVLLGKYLRPWPRAELEAIKN